MMERLVTRAGWGAKAARSTTPLRGPVAGIAVHYEGPHMGPFTHLSCAGKVRSIQGFHMNTRGWSDIAYNFVVCPHGAIYEGRGWGIRSAANGTNDGNNRYHAVCFLGGVGDPLTEEAKRALNVVIAAAPGDEVRPHRSFKATACPGETIVAWLNAGRPTSGGPVVVHQSAPAPQEKPPVAPKPKPTKVTRTAGGGFLVEATLDAAGNGWVPVNLKFANFASAIEHGPFPPDDGYWLEDAPLRLRVQPRGTKTVVVLRGRAHQRARFHVRVR